MLLGENPENDLPIATTPSKAGLQTVLDVLNIQMKFWPSLATAYSKLLSEWGTRLVENKSESHFPTKKPHLSSLHFLLIQSHWFYRKSGEEEACSGSHLVEMGTKEAFVQVSLCSYEFKIKKMLENILLIPRSNCILTQISFDTTRILM